MSLCSEVYGYGFAPFFCNLLFGIRAFGLVLGLLIMIKCLKKWKSGCCNHILKDVTATCFTQAGAKGLIWGHFSVSLLFPSDFLLVRIPLQSFDRQGEPSCWNPGIFHQNWTCSQPNITWGALSSRAVTAPVTAATGKGDWEPLLAKVIPLIHTFPAANSGTKHQISVGMREGWEWAGQTDGALGGPAVGISGNCLSEDKMIKTEELKPLWECFSSSLLLQDRAGLNTVVLAQRSQNSM